MRYSGDVIQHSLLILQSIGQSSYRRLQEDGILPLPTIKTLQKFRRPITSGFKIDSILSDLGMHDCM